MNPANPDAIELIPLPEPRRTEDRILPTLSISDAPLLFFRGIHLCGFPETRVEQIERSIRLAALLKFNYAVVTVAQAAIATLKTGLYPDDSTYGPKWILGGSMLSNDTPSTGTMT